MKVQHPSRVGRGRLDRQDGLLHGRVEHDPLNLGCGIPERIKSILQYREEVIDYANSGCATLDRFPRKLVEHGRYGDSEKGFDEERKQRANKNVDLLV